MSEPSDTDVRHVLDQFGMSAAAAEPLGNAGGFSGARIWRIRSAYCDYRLKRWPAAGPARHAVIAHLVNFARDAGLPFVAPHLAAADGQYQVAHGGRVWDLGEWLPGAADFRSNPSPVRLRAACAALARLHRVWERFAGPEQTCPGVVRRLISAGECLDATVAAPIAGILDSLSKYGPPPFDPVVPLANRARKVIEERLPQMRTLLDSWRSVKLPVQPCLCDVWHDNILFVGTDLSGLIDYGAVKQDNVAVDLARLLGSLAGNDANLYQAGLHAYVMIRPLTEAERQLVPILDRTGVVIALTNWLRWLFHDRREFADRAAALRRFSELVLRAEKQASVEA